MAAEGAVVQQYLVAKLAEMEARLELLETMQDASTDERERLVALSSRLVAALEFYDPARKAS